MAQKSSNLLETLQNADYLLSLEPEELAGPILVCLKGSQNICLEELISYTSMFEIYDQFPPRISEDKQREMRQKYPRECDNAILCALMEAWQWLERERLVAPKPVFEREIRGGGGPPYFVTRRGKSIETSDDLASYRKANLLPKHQLHPMIAQKVWALFLRGDYDTAVFQGFKEVEIAVREAMVDTDKNHGVDLMRKAFHLERGKLTDPDQQKAEKQAISDLFAGAIGYYRNAFAHRNINVTAEEAVEIIIFASHLLRIVELRQ